MYEVHFKWPGLQNQINHINDFTAAKTEAIKLCNNGALAVCIKQTLVVYHAETIVREKILKTPGGSNDSLSC
jgi:hypothetical protein